MAVRTVVLCAVVYTLSLHACDRDERRTPLPPHRDKPLLHNDPTKHKTHDVEHDHGAGGAAKVGAVVAPRDLPPDAQGIQRKHSTWLGKP